MELFDKKFVRFMWDDELEGKDVFVADNIADLIFAVRNDGKCGVKTNALCSSSRASLPFLDSIFNNCYPFAYYDPNYEVKKAFTEGKKIQFRRSLCNDWVDVSNPLWDIDFEYRIKPEEEKKWITYLARDEAKPYLTACREDIWKTAQEEDGAKTKLFVGSEVEASAWYESRQKFAEAIKAWEDGKTIQVYETLFKKWGDCAGTLEWYTDCEYRVKPECPCADGIDSKACVGCEHSEDGKREYKPYVTIDEFIQDYQERFPTAFPRPAHTKPLIWVRLKVDKRERLIVAFGTNFVEIGNKAKAVALQQLFENYVYLDGSPVGVAE